MSSFTRNALEEFCARRRGVRKEEFCEPVCPKGMPLAPTKAGEDAEYEKKSFARKDAEYAKKEFAHEKLSAQRRVCTPVCPKGMPLAPTKAGEDSEYAKKNL